MGHVLIVNLGGPIKGSSMNPFFLNLNILQYFTFMHFVMNNKTNIFAIDMFYLLYQKYVEKCGTNVTVDAGLN